MFSLGLSYIFFSHKAVGDPAVHHCFLPPFTFFFSPLCNFQWGKGCRTSMFSSLSHKTISNTLTFFSECGFFFFVFLDFRIATWWHTLSSLPLLRNLSVFLQHACSRCCLDQQLMILSITSCLWLQFLSLPMILCWQQQSILCRNYCFPLLSHFLLLLL